MPNGVAHPWRANSQVKCAPNPTPAIGCSELGCRRQEPFNSLRNLYRYEEIAREEVVLA